MSLSHTLNTNIVNFLTSLPNINDGNGQQAFINHAALDEQLHHQIKFSGSTAQFVNLLVPQLVKYGQLEDGRNALEAILETAKGYVGKDRRAYCDNLIQQLRIAPNGEEQSLSFPSRLSVQVLFEGEVQDFNETKLQALIGVIASILAIDSSFIRILHVRSGSICVTIELPGDSALELVALFKTKSEKVAQLLHQFSAESINIVEELDTPLVALVDTLNKIPAFTEQDPRTILLRAIPGAMSIKRDDNPSADLHCIVNYAVSLGKFGSGEWVLDTLQSNIHTFVPQGTPLGEEVAARFEVLKRSLQIPEKVPELRPTLSEDDIPLTDRLDVLDEIIDPLSPSYYLLDGPAGYGKTRILNKLEEIFKNRNYVCGFISASRCQNLSEAIEILCKNLNLDSEDILTTKQSAKKLGVRFANVLLRKTQPLITQTTARSSIQQTPINQGIALLVDDIGPNVPNITKELLCDFIPVTEEILRGIPFFRVVLSGRYLAQFVSTLRMRLRPRAKVLQAFDYDVVCDTVRKVLPLIQGREAWVEDISAHIMYLTGGYPKLMAQVLNKYSQNICEPQMFLDLFSDDIWDDFVSQKDDDIFKGIPEHLLPVFNRLSVLRFFNTKILTQLIKKDVIKYKGDTPGLEDELTATYLYNREKRLLRDAVTRRLLVLCLRHNTEAEQFAEFCQEAYDMYLEFLKDERLQDRELWAIECLYQALQQHISSIKKREQRSKLKTQFFDKIVPVVVKSFVMEQEEEEQELEALVYEMDRDWELRFTANYYLRDESYTEKPFAELKNKILACKKNRGV